MKQSALLNRIERLLRDRRETMESNYPISDHSGHENNKKFLILSVGFLAAVLVIAYFLRL